MLGAVRDTEYVEYLRHALAALLSRDISIFQRQFNILIDRQLFDQVETLEDEADSAAPQFTQLHFTPPSDILCVEPVLTAIVHIEHADNRQQGRFSASGRSRHGAVLTGIDFDADVVQ